MAYNIIYNFEPSTEEARDKKGPLFLTNESYLL
jgi:hypothetical protein